MSLFNIEDKLYKKDQAENLSEHDITQYNPEASKAGMKLPVKDDAWLKNQGSLVQEEKKKITTGLIVLLVVLSLVLVLAVGFEVRQLAFNSKNSSIAVVGPDQLKSGQAVTYEIDYKNDNWIGMKNAVIRISYPEEFRPDASDKFKEDSRTSGIYTLGSVPMRSSGKIFFSGKAYSPKGALIYLRTSLAYEPAFFFGNFETNAQFGINVAVAPISFEVVGPQNLASGDVLDYLISYRNDGSDVMDGLWIKAQYPEGFKFLSSSPLESTDGNTWQIGNLAPGESGELVIRGQLEGGDGITRSAKISIGVVSSGEFVSYNDENVDTQIISSRLVVSQTVNDKSQLNINAGEYLRFKIVYKNNSGIGLRDVILTEELASPILDYATLDTEKGNFDGARNMITWKASDIPAFKNLAPGASGEIIFSIKVKDIIPLDGNTKKNFAITSLAKIDSPDVPTPISTNKIISSNSLNMKLNSKMILSTSGFYNDAKIPNSGPIPPRVGQETTYTLHWKVRNVSNDINNATVTANLPTNAVMTGKIFPDDARINYNERTNSITWNIGKMDAGEGMSNTAPEVAFQVKINPSLDQFKRTVGLLGQSILSADDLFTKEKLSVTNDAKTINLAEDAALLAAGGEAVAK